MIIINYFFITLIPLSLIKMITTNEIKIISKSVTEGNNKTRRECIAVINEKLNNQLSPFEKKLCINAINKIIDNTESEYHSFIPDYYEASRKLYVLMECDRLKATCQDCDLTIEKDFSTQYEYDNESRRLFGLVQSVDIKEIEISCKNTFIKKYNDEIIEMLLLINEYKKIISEAKLLLTKLN